MGEVVGLKGEVVDDRKVNQDLVEMLELLTEQARSGEINNLWGVIQFHDGATASRWSAGSLSIAMLGRMQLTLERMAEIFK